LPLLCISIALALLTSPTFAYSTQVTVTKYDAYGAVIGGPQTVDINWMENTPVYGDGTTHYFFHGPTFDYSSYDTLWDPDENDNVLSRDYGAVKGTDVRDLCNLVGGMDVNDYVTIKATDNFAKIFDYDDVYTPDTDEMRMVLAWYNGEESITGESQGVGYPDTGYSVGMRLHFFADTSNNPWGHHCFGIWDMHENLDPNRWHYYYDGNFWPSSSGLSVKYTNRVEIYQPKLISCDASGNPVDSFAPGETVYVKGRGLSASTSYKLWIQPEPVMSPLDGLDRPVSGASYTFSTGNDPSGAQETVTTNATGDFGPVAIWSAAATTGNYDIVADNQAQGTAGKYDNKDAIDNPGRQGFVVAVSPVADFSTDVTSGCEPLTVSFTDTSTGPPTSRAWDFGDGYTATVVKPVHVYKNAGTYTVTLNVSNAYGSDEEVKTNYITVSELPTAPTGAFMADVLTGEVPLMVHFTDQSNGTAPLTYAWDFDNNGTVDSTDQNPVYNYTSAGTYTVKLNVTNAYGSDEEVKIDYITVTEHGVCGDVNNDGKLTMGDGRLIYLNVIYGDAEYPLANPWAADVNDDDKITMGDGRLVYLHVIYGAEEYPLNCGS
jgi:PKD repeat protein